MFLLSSVCSVDATQKAVRACGVCLALTGFFLLAQCSPSPSVLPNRAGLSPFHGRVIFHCVAVPRLFYPHFKKTTTTLWHQGLATSFRWGMEEPRRGSRQAFRTSRLGRGGGSRAGRPVRRGACLLLQPRDCLLVGSGSGLRCPQQDGGLPEKGQRSKSPLNPTSPGPPACSQPSAHSFGGSGFKI